MNSEESIALAQKLKKEYGDLEKITRQIRHNELILSRPVSDPKNLVNEQDSFPASGTIGCGTLLAIFTLLFFEGIIYVFATVALFIDKSKGEKVLIDPETVFTIIMIFNIGLLIAASIISSVRKRKLKEEMQKRAEEDYEKSMRRRTELRENTDVLIQVWNEKKQRLAQYDALVPASLQTANSMIQVRNLIMSNKADDFSEALAMVEEKYRSDEIQNPDSEDSK